VCAGLERRTARGGRDTIDHAPGGHDDLANVVAGVAVVATRPRQEPEVEAIVIYAEPQPTLS
jgi:hypothetical protein